MYNCRDANNYTLNNNKSLFSCILIICPKLQQNTQKYLISKPNRQKMTLAAIRLQTKLACALGSEMIFCFLITCTCNTSSFQREREATGKGGAKCHISF